MKSSRKIGVVAWLFGWLLTAPAVAGERLKPLEVGVFPNLSARAVVTMYQPVRDILEKDLGRPVRIYTAPDFKTFVERTNRGQYDLVVTAPHFARLAQTEAGYQPLVNYVAALRGVVVVPRQAAVAKLEDLRGKAVAVPDQLAVMSMVGVALLREHGVSPEAGARVQYTRSHSNAALSVLRGEMDAAVIGSAPYAQLPDDVRGGLRVVAYTDPIPNQFYLANPSLPPEVAAEISRSLLRFAATPKGGQFFSMPGFGGLKAADEGELKKMDPYAKEARRLLGQSQ